MVVVAGVLRVVPADEPDVETRVAVELGEVPLVRVVPNEVLPDTRRIADGAGKRRRFVAFERASGGDVRRDQGPDVIHSPRSLAGLADRTASVTASPNDRITSSAGMGSITGMSLPNSIGSTPYVDMARSSALRP